MVDRQAILQEEINRLLNKGRDWETGHGRWRLVIQNETSAQLIQPKTFSASIAILWFVLLPVVGLIFYVLYYAGKRDRHLYLTVDENGQVQRHQS